jgi:hypothetical protein
MITFDIRFYPIIMPMVPLGNPGKAYCLASSYLLPILCGAPLVL